MLFNRAMPLISGKALELDIGTWRPIGMYESERSTLDPELPKIWYVEYRHHDQIFTNYDDFERKASTAWTPNFRFIFESCSLSEFQPQVQ